MTATASGVLDSIVEHALSNAQWAEEHGRLQARVSKLLRDESQIPAAAHVGIASITQHTQWAARVALQPTSLQYQRGIRQAAMAAGFRVELELVTCTSAADQSIASDASLVLYKARPRPNAWPAIFAWLGALFVCTYLLYWTVTLRGAGPRY